VEETGVPGENMHRPAASNWQTLSHDDLTLRVNSQQHINIESKFYKISIKTGLFCTYSMQNKYSMGYLSANAVFL
jgi:hypothetical protein